jgi:aminoglycoside phosphotransferase (APT) family kinase protein
MTTEPTATDVGDGPGADGGTSAGIDLPRVTEWIVANVDGLTPPFTPRFISGGRSNLTYQLVDATGRAIVLRRPPLGHVLQSAHDMGREHRIIAALRDTDVPVANALGLCEDVSVNDAPFYLMDFVDGAVLATIDDANAYPEASRTRAAEELIDVLGRLHAVDPDAVGLGTLGRKEGYIARQLKRWHTQFTQSKTRELPLLDEVHDRLEARMPPQRWTGIVHGDFRLGNMILGADGSLLAVLDWELATLGDTLADLGWLLSGWVEAGEPTRGPFPPPTTATGFPTRDGLAERYGKVTGRDLSDLPYYLAFARWRGACISEGVLNRYKRAVMGEVDFDLDAMATSVELSVNAARDALDQLG